ncbi:hypothetical protein OD757_06970 [Acinetobacter sp. AYS6]|uniref:hypothetical protein n=1 Tax=Acinetobacter sp. AYS6 TaxID=2983297 RepID=UPI0021D6694D|nr:hypothetical protein [Acinetobacter sp. AYS6]MCU7696961.1 hypothetical protein [Acinetobacter sp. AYS6]
MINKLFIISPFLLLGCSLQPIETFELEINYLNDENSNLIALEKKLEPQCEQAIANLKFGIVNKSLNIKELIENQDSVCGNLYYVVNKVLENNQRLVDLELLIQEKSN